MTNYRYLFILMLICSFSISYAQMDISSWRAFEKNPELLKTIGNSYEDYIKASYPDSIPNSEMGEYKAYMRYMYYWQRRLGENAQGELSYEPYLQVAKDYLSNPICTNDLLADWEIIEPEQSHEQEQGLISELLYDPQNPDQLLISSNHGGLWKYNSNNDFWYNVTDTDNLRVPGIAATEIIRNPYVHNELFASTANGVHDVDYGVGIIRSVNNGESWSIIPGLPDGLDSRVIKIVIDPSDSYPVDGITMYAISETKVYYTQDSGDNWDTLVSQPNLNQYTELYDLEVDDNGDLLLASRGRYKYVGQCFKYSNSTWNEMLTNIDTINIQRAKFTTPNEGKVFAMLDLITDTVFYPNGDIDYYITSRRIFESINNGNSWQLKIENIGGVDPKCEIEYSSESGYLYIGRIDLWILDIATNQHVKVKKDPNFYNYHADIRDISIIRNTENYETILFANDGGVTELTINKNNIEDISTNNLSGHYLSANNLIGIGVGNGSSKFAMAGGVHGNSLKVINNIAFPGGDADGGDCMVHPEDENKYYHMSNNKLISGNDNVFHSDVDQWFIGMRYAMDPNNHDIIYFGQKDTFGIYNENTNQVSLKALPNYSSEDDKLKKVGAIEKSTNGIIYISDFSIAWGARPYRMLKSVDEGDIWTDMSSSIVYDINGNPGTLANRVWGKTINSIESNPNNPNELWLCIGGVSKNNGVIDNVFRVLHSTNGGDTWYDYSEGLTAFPANYIYYHYPTEMLFVATDAGVFYRNPSDSNMTQWDCFSNNLPMGIVTDLDASTCNNMLYASMDGRGIYRTPIPFPIINFTGNTIIYENSYIVSGDEIWNTTRYFDGDIMVPPNTSLRINDKVLFTENGSITVMPGGELFVNGVLDIAESCSHTFWKGIQLRGNANYPQTLQYQGVVRTFSGAEIRNAEIGIAAYGIDHNNNGNYIQDSQGGIVIIDNATFINNKVSIDIRDYNYTNISTAYNPVIINSTFKTTETFYGDPAETPIGVQILNNNNVVVSDCRFEGNDNLPYLPSHLLYPIGIKTWNSPTEINNCEFANIGFGVHAMDIAASSNYVNIDKNYFYRCSNSIYLNGLSSPRVSRNILTNQLKEVHKNLYLIYMDQCNNFMVEENEFFLTIPSAFSADPNFGIIINNCGASNNSIYKNSFEKGYCGILAQNENRDANGDNGLTIKCNTFNQTVRNNIMVSAMIGTPEAGIAAAQGKMGGGASDPAGNLFSNVFTNNGLTTTDSHFWNISSLNATVTYYHHNPSAPDVPYLVEPGYDSQDHLINGIDKELNDEAEWNDYTCPSHFPSGGGGDDHKSRMASAAVNIENIESNLQALTDGGNTEALNTEVNTANSNEGYALRNELLNSSPYISDTVLKNTTNIEEVLTNPLLRDVLVANPQAAKNQAILDAIDSRNNAMPNYMKEQILNGQTITGQKEQMEANLQVNRAKYVNALNYVIYEYYQDTTINALDSIIPLLASAKTIEAHYQLAGIYLKQNNATAMNNILNSIPSTFNLDDHQQTELQDLTAYYALLQNVKANNRSINELNENEKSDLWAWRNDSSNMVSAFARNLLVYLGELEYIAPIILPDMNNKSSLITEPFDIDIPKDEYGYINAYPNPANNYFICEYDIKVKYQNAQIIISEAATGKLVEKLLIYSDQDSKTIDLTSFKSGAYIISLKVDENILSSSKINIIK